MLFLLTTSKDNHKHNRITQKLHQQPGHEMYSAEEQFRVIEDGQKAFKEAEKMGELSGSEQIFQDMMRRLEEMKANARDIVVPTSLKKELYLLKKETW
jgi:hypothetical protein